MKKNIYRKLLVFLLIFSLVFSTGIGRSFANEETFTLIIENKNYKKEDGAPWEGELIKEEVPLKEGYNLLDYTKEVVEKNGYEISIENKEFGSYLASINGLKSGMGSDFSGYTFLVNDWIADKGMGEFSLENGNLKEGYEVRIAFSLDFTDLGGDYNSNDKTLKSLEFSEGKLDKEFDPNVFEYNLTLDGEKEILVNSTANNKNYMVKNLVGDSYKEKNAPIKAEDSLIFYVVVGDENWPSVNNFNSNLSKSPKVEYKINIHILNDFKENFTSFRGNENNNGVVNEDLPTSLDNIKLKNVINLGPTWEDAASQMIVVDDAIITFNSKKIYKIDIDSVEIIKENDLSDSSAYGLVSPTYGNGMIFVPLNNGTIEAFDAKNLESLWIYKDELKGQGLNPISYKDGYIYTGFWSSDGSTNLVGIEAKDFIKGTNEEKVEPIFTYKLEKGQYWQGGLVIGNYYIFGDEEGILRSIDKLNGELIDSIEFSSKIRSSLVYYNYNIYFMTNDGTINKVGLDEKGKFIDKKSEKIGMGSTSTPVIYEDKIYVSVLDEDEPFLKLLDMNFETLDKIRLRGYSQSSALLNIFNEDEGYIDLYLSYNKIPGGLTLIRFNQNGSELVEIYEAKGYEQYSTSSPISDGNGNLIFKNDSGNIFLLEKIKEDNTIDNWKFEDGSWYYYKNGEKIVDKWIWAEVKINGEIKYNWKYFNKEGKSQNTFYIDNRNVWLSQAGPNEEYYRGWWENESGMKYYFRETSGSRVSGWQYIDGFWRYFRKSGTMVKGWQYIDNHWRFFREDGSLVVDKWVWIPVDIDNDGEIDKYNWKYFNKKGENQSTFYIDGGNVWLSQVGPNKEYHHGWWENESGMKYYFRETSGSRVSGWQYIDGFLRYFRKSGTMVTGKQWIDGKWYIFTNDGRLK